MSPSADRDELELVSAQPEAVGAKVQHVPSASQLAESLLGLGGCGSYQYMAAVRAEHERLGIPLPAMEVRYQ